MSKGKIITILLATMLISIYMVVGIVYAPKLEGQHPCTTVEVVIKDSAERSFVTRREVLQTLAQRQLNPVGTNMETINTFQIEQLLQKNSMIKSVECYKTTNQTIRITLEQRTPKFRVMDTESYYVDTERKLMPTRINAPVYVPVVTGRVTKSTAQNELYELVEYLDNHRLWKSQIVQIHFTDPKNIELIPRVGSHVIILGKIEEYREKMEKLEKLYTNGFTQIGWREYKSIDLRYKNQIVCSK